MDNTIPVEAEAVQPITIKYFVCSTVRQDTWFGTYMPAQHWLKCFLKSYRYSLHPPWDLQCFRSAYSGVIPRLIDINQPTALVNFLKRWEDSPDGSFAEALCVPLDESECSEADRTDEEGHFTVCKLCWICDSQHLCLPLQLQHNISSSHGVSCDPQGLRQWLWPKTTGLARRKVFESTDRGNRRTWKNISPQWLK